MGLHVRGDFRNLGIAHAHFFLLYLACAMIVGMKALMSSQTKLAIRDNTDTPIQLTGLVLPVLNCLEHLAKAR